MQADRFTIKSQEALAAAGRLAEERRNPQVTPLHLLSALLAEGAAAGAGGQLASADAPGGVVLPVLAKLGVQPGALRAGVEEALGALPVLGSGSGGEAPGQPGSELVAVLRAAEREAGQLGDQYVSTEHLLLAITADKGPSGQALAAAGVNHDKLLQALSVVR